MKKIIFSLLFCTQLAVFGASPEQGIRYIKDAYRDKTEVSDVVEQLSNDLSLLGSIAEVIANNIRDEDLAEGAIAEKAAEHIIAFMRAYGKPDEEAMALYQAYKVLPQSSTSISAILQQIYDRYEPLLQEAQQQMWQIRLKNTRPWDLFLGGALWKQRANENDLARYQKLAKLVEAIRAITSPIKALAIADKLLNSPALLASIVRYLAKL